MKQLLITGVVVFVAALLSNGYVAQSGQFDSHAGPSGEVRAEVENVVAGQVGNRAVFTYDLAGDEGATEVFVEITIGGKAYRPSDLHMEGDFGEVATGSGKRIYWNVLRDFPRGFSGVVQWEIMAAKSVGDYTNSLGINFVYIGPGTFLMGSPSDSVGMTFNYIEPGKFLMGSPPDEPGSFLMRDPSDEPGRWSNETQHQVTLTQGYYMQSTPVTQGQWEVVMGDNPSYFSDCGADCPMETVSWHDVQDFITALNDLEDTNRYALPTEAQWEYAARAGSPTAFANGEITETGDGYDPVLDSMGWYTHNSNGRTHPVAQKAPNAWGLYDMHGNVWEWVADWYGTYPTSAVIDPTGPSTGTNRVMRGGSWSSNARFCRSANRSAYYPGYRFIYFGFRLVLLPDH